MKKLTTLLAAASLMTLATSCKKPEPPAPEPAKPEPEKKAAVSEAPEMQIVGEGAIDLSGNPGEISPEQRKMLEEAALEATKNIDMSALIGALGGDASGATVIQGKPQIQVISGNAANPEEMKKMIEKLKKDLPEAAKMIEGAEVVSEEIRATAIDAGSDPETQARMQKAIESGDQKALTQELQKVVQEAIDLSTLQQLGVIEGGAEIQLDGQAIETKPADKAAE